MKIEIQASGDKLRIRGDNARAIIRNVYWLVRRKYSGRQLWSLVGDITGHGCGHSIDICRSAGLEPYQRLGGKDLIEMKPPNSFQASAVAVEEKQ